MCKQRRLIQEKSYVQLYAEVGRVAIMFTQERVKKKVGENNI